MLNSIIIIAKRVPGCLVVRMLDFHCHGPGSIPGQGTEILQAVKDKMGGGNSQKVETTQMSILINDLKNVVNEELVHATSWMIEKCTRF